MTVVHVIPSLTGGGAEKTARLIAGHQAEHFEVHVVTWLDGITESGGLGSHFSRHKLQYGYSGILKFLELLRGLRRTLRELKPDGIISHLSYTNVLTFLASFGLKIKTIIYVHHSSVISGSWIEKKVIRFLYRNNALVVVSEESAQSMRQLKANNVIVVPNPIEMVGGGRRVGPWSSNQKLKLISIGRLVPDKNYELTFQVLEELDCEYEIHIFGAGNGDLYESHIRERAAGLPVQFRGRAQFVTPLEELEKSHVFLMTSHAEGEPSALLEAAFTGIPVVGRSTPGLSAAVTKVGGFKVSHDETPAKIADLIKEAASTGRNSREISEWSKTHDIDRASHLYCEIIEGC